MISTLTVRTAAGRRWRTVATVRGKSTGDKREAIKKREHKREMDRAVRRK